MTRILKNRVRLGIVPFLNVGPLVHGLTHGSLRERYDLVFGHPSDLARRLAAGEIDAAILSVTAAAGNGGSFEIVPGIAIASDGPVESVRLFHRGPLRSVRRVILDRRSLTSSILVRLLLDERLGIRPHYDAGDPDPPGIAPGEAALAIGDTGLRYRALPSLDLGEAWRDWTGLAFVYAVWTARPGALDEEDVRALHASRAEGLAAMDAIVSEATREGWPAQLVESYLTRAIRYDLDGRAVDGLIEFLERASSAGLLDAPPALPLIGGTRIRLRGRTLTR